MVMPGDIVDISWKASSSCGMRVLGIDFTSSPRPSKPIICIDCMVIEGVLHARKPAKLGSFEEFEQMLRVDGPWIAGIDFPFGQSRTFIENIDWPKCWSDYVDHVRRLGRNGFSEAVRCYAEDRAYGDKEHRRKTDRAAGSFSPQKLNRPGVALMFFEGAWRLLDAGVTIPHLHPGDPARIAIEAYPGVLARRLIGRRKYKDDARTKQTEEQRAARLGMLEKITNGDFEDEFGFRVNIPGQLVDELADDKTGDSIDALLCAMQAAWAWAQRENGYGAPKDVDSLEGWIADPTLAASPPTGK